ncbi:MAG: dolichol-phosphate mannosyltransferase [Parcubacteria bacterium C7867-007]|nr:MAG: dolichol-phosphate mannosyltransferase [Parcubacteria bacterium C7867-007]
MSRTEERLLSVIIPCFNEAETIVQVVERVTATELPSGWSKEIIVVDDGSKEETHVALRKLSSGSVENTVQVVYLPLNLGKGGAVKEGLRHATGEYCIIQDADLEIDPGQYPSLLAPIIEGRVDTVFGYRTLAEEDAHRNRMLFYGGRLVSSFYNLAFKSSFKDVPCCYKVFPRERIPALLAAPSDDFVFDAIEMTYILQHAGTVTQVPISYHPRTVTEGKKIRARHGLYCLLAIVFFRLGIHSAPMGKEVPKALRFLTTGSISVLVNIAVLYILTDISHLWYLLSSVVAFVTSGVVNFLLHKYWTFNYKHQKSTAIQVPLHLLVASINLVLNTGIVFILVHYLGVWYILAQAIAALIIAIESFLVLSRFIFKRA